MTLKKIIEQGPITGRNKPLLTRKLQSSIENSSNQIFGGVRLKDLPGWSFPIALIYITIFVSAFLGLVIKNAQQDQKVPFVSLDKEASGSTCTSVAKDLTGSYKGTYDGYWETDPRYEDSKSLIVLEFSGQRSKSGFETSLVDFARHMKGLTKLCSERALFFNLILLNSLMFVGKEGDIKLVLSTDASFNFNNMMTVSALSNAGGICIGSGMNTKNPFYISGSFNDALSSLSVRFSFPIDPSTTTNAAAAVSTQQSEMCESHGNWVNDAFNPSVSEFRTGTADLDFDARSTILAIALNMNLVGVTGLTEVASKLTESLGLVGYLDPYYEYPAMQRIYCLKKDHNNWRRYFKQDEIDDYITNIRSSTELRFKYPSICFVVSSSKSSVIQLYYPVINQLSMDGHLCTCPKYEKDIECNRQRLIVGFLYDRVIKRGNSVSGALNVQDNAMIELAIRIQHNLVWGGVNDMVGMGKISANDETGWSWENKDADIEYLQLFTGVLNQTKSLFNSYHSAPSKISLKKEWNVLCSLSLNATKCTSRVSAVVVESDGIVGQTQFILPINPFNIEVSDLVEDSKKIYHEKYAGINLVQTSCQDPFVKIIEGVKKLSKEPPVYLEERYYECKRRWWSTFIVSIGSVFGLTTMITTFLWTVIGFLGIRLLKWHLGRFNVPDTIIGHRGRAVLEEAHEVIKDEYLAKTVSALRKRILLLEYECDFVRGIKAEGKSIKTLKNARTPTPTRSRSRSRSRSNHKAGDDYNGDADNNDFDNNHYDEEEEEEEEEDEDEMKEEENYKTFYSLHAGTNKSSRSKKMVKILVNKANEMEKDHDEKHEKLTRNTLSALGLINRQKNVAAAAAAETTGYRGDEEAPGATRRGSSFARRDSGSSTQNGGHQSHQNFHFNGSRRSSLSDRRDRDRDGDRDRESEGGIEFSTTRLSRIQTSRTEQVLSPMAPSPPTRSSFSAGRPSFNQQQSSSKGSGGGGGGGAALFAARRMSENRVALSPADKEQIGAAARRMSQRAFHSSPETATLTVTSDGVSSPVSHTTRNPMEAVLSTIPPPQPSTLSHSRKI